MSGDGMEDMWLWDERGDIAFAEGRLKGWELQEYAAIREMRKVAFCSVCGSPANYRYAPCDPPPAGTEERCWPIESRRWRCDTHKPYDATDEGWNGEWDEYEWL